MGKLTVKQAAARIATTRVEQLMIPIERYPTVNTTTPLREAIKLIDEFELDVDGCKSPTSVLLVFDDKKRLAGIVRRRDLMRGLEPQHLTDVPLYDRKRLFDPDTDPQTSAKAYDKLVRGVWAQAKRPVADVMRPVGVTIDCHDVVMKAIYEIVSYGVTTLPVMKKRRVAGVLRSVEVFHELVAVVA